MNVARLPSPDQVRAACAARAARVDAHFDDLAERMQVVHAGFVADGLIRPATSRTRAGDPPRPQA